MQLLKRFWSEEDGLETVEWAVLSALIVTGLVTTIGLLILDVKAAFALGLIAGLMEFIPTVGPLLSAIPAVAMGFLDSPQKALTVAVLYMGIQFLENHLLIPMLMKGGVDVPPVLTILGQALFTLLFGFLGLMVAVPALAWPWRTSRTWLMRPVRRRRRRAPYTAARGTARPAGTRRRPRSWSARGGSGSRSAGR